MKRHAANRSNRIHTGEAIYANTADITFVRQQTFYHKTTPFYPSKKKFGMDKDLSAIIAVLANTAFSNVQRSRIKGMDHHAGTLLKYS